MADLFFALRMFVIAVAVSVAMQIKIGEATIEHHSLEWIQTSSMVGGLRDIAGGAIKATSQAMRGATDSVDATLNRAFRRDSQPGSRTLGLSLERSSAAKQAHEEKRRTSEARSPASRGLGEATEDDGSLPER